MPEVKVFIKYFLGSWQILDLLSITDPELDKLSNAKIKNLVGDRAENQTRLYQTLRLRL